MTMTPPIAASGQATTKTNGEVCILTRKDLYRNTRVARFAMALEAAGFAVTVVTLGEPVPEYRANTNYLLIDRKQLSSQRLRVRDFALGDGFAEGLGYLLTHPLDLLVYLLLCLWALYRYGLSALKLIRLRLFGPANCPPGGTTGGGGQIRQDPVARRDSGEQPQ